MPRQDHCTPCALGWYKEDGMEACAACGEGRLTASIGAASRSQCVSTCGYGSYLGDYGCRRCDEVELEAMTCDGGPAEVQAGWWRYDGFSFHRCRLNDVCLGGDAYSINCANHHTGPLCEVGTAALHAPAG
jgi:hypothetical protein